MIIQTTIEKNSKKEKPYFFKKIKRTPKGETRGKIIQKNKKKNMKNNLK
jgi:hypothetical protein